MPAATRRMVSSGRQSGAGHFSLELRRCWRPTHGDERRPRRLAGRRSWRSLPKAGLVRVLQRVLERFHRELKRRSLVVRIFPNDASWLRLLRALAAEQHEEWLDGTRYLDLQPLADHSKTQLQLAA